MFSSFFVLTSIVVWIMPVMTIAGAIFRKDLLTRKEWIFLVFFSIVGASYVSYSSWQDRNIGLVPIGKEYLSCQLKSRNEPDPETFRTVTLDSSIPDLRLGLQLGNLLLCSCSPCRCIPEKCHLRLF